MDKRKKTIDELFQCRNDDSAIAINTNTFYWDHPQSHLRLSVNT